MSVQHALDFIQQVEKQPALRDALRDAFADQGLSGIVTIGRAQGMVFDVPQLRTAFAIDWQMRYLHGTSLPKGS